MRALLATLAVAALLAPALPAAQAAHVACPHEESLARNLPRPPPTVCATETGDGEATCRDAASGSGVTRLGTPAAQDALVVEGRGSCSRATGEARAGSIVATLRLGTTTLTLAWTSSEYENGEYHESFREVRAGVVTQDAEAGASWRGTHVMESVACRAQAQVDTVPRDAAVTQTRCIGPPAVPALPWGRTTSLLP